MKLNTFLMNSYKDFCKNACALMAKLNQGLSILVYKQCQFIWQNLFGYLKSLTTDVSISKSFKLRISKTIINQDTIYFV